MKKSFFWNSIGTAAWSFLSLALLIVVTRINGIEASGAFSFAFAFALIMYSVSTYGGRVYQVSDHKNIFNNSTYFTLRLVSSLCAFLLTLLFIWLNNFSSQLSLLITLLVLQRIIDALADVFHGILQKNDRLYIVGRSLFYKSVVSFVAFLAIDLATHNLVLSTALLPLTSLIYLVFYDIQKSSSFDKIKIKKTMVGVKKLARATFLPFLIVVLSLVFANLARYFIEVFHPDLQGYFGIIIMPLSLILLLSSFVLTPFIVTLTKTYHSGEYNILHKIIGRIFLALSGGSAILILLTILFSSPLLTLLFGIDFSSYIWDVTLVVVIGYLLSVTSIFINVSIISRKLTVPVYIYLISILILIILCLLIIPSMGIIGAVVAYLVSSFIQSIAMFMYYGRLTNGQKLSKNTWNFYSDNQP